MVLGIVCSFLLQVLRHVSKLFTWVFFDLSDVDTETDTSLRTIFVISHRFGYIIVLLFF